MGLVVASTFGLVVWLVLWSLGAKSFDAFLITITIVLIAAAVHIGKTYLPDRDLIDE